MVRLQFVVINKNSSKESSKESFKPVFMAGTTEDAVPFILMKPTINK